MTDITFAPLPEEHYLQVWRWLHEYWELNSDDFSAQSFTDFEKSMRARSETEEIWEVLDGGSPIGVIGYRAATKRNGWVRGIVFSQTVHGTPVTKMAVSMFLAKKFGKGVEKVNLTYFQSNFRVARFLERLGAVVEGLLIADTIQHGQPVNSVLVAFFAP